MLLSITLIGNPSRGLREGDIEAAKNFLTTDEFSVQRHTWLSENEAADLFVEGDESATRAVLSPWSLAQKIDIIVQPAATRRKKALLADMESTSIENEMLDELAARAGIGDKVAEITRRSMNGEIDFKAALIERLALLKDVPESVVQELVGKIVYMPGAVELLATLKKHGIHTVLVSGGFTVFTEVVARHLGFDEHYGNVLAIANGKLTGLPVEPILTREAKRERLAATAAALNIPESEIGAVGDGANDLHMLLAAGLGVAYHGKSVVADKARHNIRFGTLRGLLWAMGFKREELAV